MALGNDVVPISTSLLTEKEVSGSLQTNQLRKALNEKSVKYQEKLYWLKLELDTTRKEKQAVEARMTGLFRDMQELKEKGGGGSRGVGQLPSNGNRSPTNGNGEMESLVQKHERTVRTLQAQIELLRSSSDQVVQSLKDEIRDLVAEKARSEMELMNHLADVEKEKDAMTKGLGRDNNSSLKPGENAELKLEIQQLRQEKANLIKEFGMNE